MENSPTPVPSYGQAQQNTVSNAFNNLTINTTPCPTPAPSQGYSEFNSPTCAGMFDHLIKKEKELNKDEP